MPAGPCQSSLLIQPLSGYPDPFVAARLTPRLIRLRQSGAASDASARTWPSLRHAVQWSYRLLTQAKRQQMETLYLFLELPLLVTALRLAVAGERQRSVSLLEKSQWSHAVRQVVTGARDLARLEKGLTSQLSPVGWEIPSTDPDTGRHPLQELEQRLYHGLFRMMRNHAPSPPLAECFAAFFDLFNLAALRAGPSPHASAFVQGGKLPTAKLQNPERVDKLLVRHYGKLPTQSAGYEQHLKHAFAATLLQRARSEDLVTCLLAYLWGHFARLDTGGHGNASDGRER